MNTRRGFLGALLAAAVAPAFVRADTLMPLYVPKSKLLTLWGDGVQDDTAALQALFSGGPVLYAGRTIGGSPGLVSLPHAEFLISAPLTLVGGTNYIGNGAKVIAGHGGTVMRLREDAENVSIQQFHLVSKEMYSGPASNQALRWNTSTAVVLGERRSQPAGFYWGER